MSEWSKNKVDSFTINGGEEFTADDNLALDELNSIVNNSFYASDKAKEALDKANDFIVSQRGTTVTIDGNPQSTWDAGFIEGEREKISRVGEILHKGEQPAVFAENERQKTETNGEIVHEDDFNNTVENLAKKDLSNVTYPQVIADGVSKMGAGDRVIETRVSSDSNTWYRIWASGWKECGGRFAVPESGETITYTMPIAFTSTESYFAIGIRGSYPNLSANANIGTVSLRQLSNQTFDVQTYNGPYTYYACGY